MAFFKYLAIGLGVLYSILLLYTLVFYAIGKAGDMDEERLARFTLEGLLIIAWAAIIWHFDIDLSGLLFTKN